MKNLLPILRNGQYLMLAFMCLFVLSCSDETDFLQPNEEDTSSLLTRGAFNNGYFDWDMIDEKIEFLSNTGKTMSVTLPWIGGSGHNLGIPEEWIDPQAKSSVRSQRYYSRDNGWVMVYSNFNLTSELNKYFALYNKYTGILRFFFYSIGTNTGSSGSNSTFIGINTSKPSSMFNFTTDIATGMNERKQSPAYSFSPNIKTVNGNPSAIGYAVNQWYGMEIECSYDRNIENNTCFSTVIWAAKISSSQGNMSTKGDIKGNITSSAPNMPNLSLQFGSNISTSIKNTVTVNQSSLGAVLGDSIDIKISKGDPFFKGVWNNIKRNASQWISAGALSGAKKGIEAIVSSGGSVIGKSLEGFVNSLLGRDKQNIMKVDLSFTAESVIKLDHYESVTGWNISPFPVPGARSYDAPLYNEPLGVWNLEKTPQVKNNIYRYRSNNLLDSYSTNTFILQPTNIILNPAIASQCVVKNKKQYLLVPRYQMENTQSYSGNEELVGFDPYYNVGTSWTTPKEVGGLGMILVPYGVKVRVSFDLYDRNTNEKLAHFCKTFDHEPVEGTIREEWAPILGPGGGGLRP